MLKNSAKQTLKNLDSLPDMAKAENGQKRTGLRSFGLTPINYPISENEVLIKFLKK